MASTKALYHMHTRIKESEWKTELTALMPLAPIINMREFINNVEVLCQMSKTGCYTATIKHNAYLCGMSRNNRFLFKTLEISHTHTTTVALQTFINISFWSCMIKPPIFNAFVQCSGGDRCPNDELLFSTGFSDQTRRKWNVELCTQKYSKASFIVFF